MELGYLMCREVLTAGVALPPIPHPKQDSQEQFCVDMESMPLQVLEPMIEVFVEQCVL